MKKTPVKDIGIVQLLPIDEIADSPFNPRRTCDPAKLQELADSIQSRGVDSPIKVRPAPNDHGGYELIYGHRRRLASKMAGRATVPAFVVDMTDAEVREAQLVENGQREDVHPLEEADAFEAAMRLDKLSAKEIGDKIGKSEGYVYGRLKLAKLCPEAREAFMAGKLTASTALIVARIPNEKLQKQATEDISRSRFRDEPMSASEASAHVRQTYMLRLALAPFDRADAQLVPAAGACVTCPKRTGAQRDLFADVEDKHDLCIDPMCWQSKHDAEWKARVAAAKAAGRPVLTDAEAKKLYPYGDYLAGDGARNFVDIARTCFDDPKSRTYEQLLKKAKPVTTLVRDPKGGIHELLPKKGLEKLLKDAGHDFKKERAEGATPGETAKQKAKRLQEKATRELREKVTDAAKLKLVERAEKSADKPEAWRLTAQLLVGRGGPALDRRKVGTKKGDIEKYLAGLSKGQLFGLLFEDALGECYSYTDYDEDLVVACKALGVDLKALERELAPKPEPAAAAPAKGKGAKAAQAKAPAKKGGKK